MYILYTQCKEYPRLALPLKQNIEECIPPPPQCKYKLYKPGYII